MEKVSVCAVLPTYNRREKVEIAIRSILAQTRPVDRILVINNACVDNTAELLTSLAESHLSLRIVTLEKNIGASGAYYTGIKKAAESGADLVWTLDDDAYPDPTCLEELLETADHLPSWSFICSHVVRPDGVSNQVPHIYTGMNACGCPDWATMSSHGAVCVAAATWNSCLISAETIKAVGYPFRDFVMWAEDIEFTERLAGHAPAYFCGRSRVVHDTPSKSGHGILKETDERRIRLYFYFYRNLTFMRRREGRKRVVLSSLRTLSIALQCLLGRDHQWLRARAVLTGWFAGLTFTPELETFQPAREVAPDLP